MTLIVDCYVSAGHREALAGLAFALLEKRAGGFDR
jgi:hypothetical protein